MKKAMEKNLTEFLTVFYLCFENVLSELVSVNWFETKFTGSWKNFRRNILANF